MSIMLTDPDGNPLNALIERRPAGKPHELWIYAGSGEWNVHVLEWWNVSKNIAKAGALLRTEFKLK